jgi:hypothetical protein
MNTGRPRLFLILAVRPEKAEPIKQLEFIKRPT